MKVLTKKKLVLVGLMLTNLTKICSAIDCQDKEKKTITCVCPDKNQECEEDGNTMGCRTKKHQLDEATKNKSFKDCAGECPLSLLTAKQMILCGNHCAETCEDCIWKVGFSFFHVLSMNNIHS